MRERWTSAGARPPSSAERRERTYGRRHGRKLRPGRRRLLEDVLPRLRPPMAQLGTLARRLSSGPFGGYSDVWLEIGFGQGEHLAAQAQANPGILFIGCEPYADGVSSLLRAIESRAIGNVLVHDDDARVLLDSLPDAGIGRLFLLFPDPWPKRRHHKRRFVSPTNLDRITRVLLDGAEFRFATDHAEYARWTLRRAIDHPDLEWPAERPADWRARPADWPPTRYEEKARAQGLASTYLRFRRRTRA